MIITEGRWGTVEWAIDAGGSSPAQRYYRGLSDSDKAKMLTLFQRLANDGDIRNREKFRKVEEQDFRVHELSAKVSRGVPRERTVLGVLGSQEEEGQTGPR